MTHTKTMNLVFLVLLTVGLIGCGGGGGSGSSPSADTVTGLTTSDIRTYKKGDMFIYTLSLSDPESGETASGDVSNVIGDIVQNPFGIDCRAMVISGTLTSPSGTEAYLVRALMYQDNNNSLYDCGTFDDTLGRYVFLTDTDTSPNGVFLEIKSPVQIGDITSGIVFSDDGSWSDCTRTVQSKENISVPLGLYESYKISDACSFSNGSTFVTTTWNVPDLFDLKSSGVVDNFSLEIIVKSTNLN